MRGNRRSRAARLALVLALGAGLSSSGCALLLGGVAAGGAAGGVAAARAGREESHPATSYVGSVLASAVYFPAKVLFAGAGAAASGVTYLATLGRPEPAHRIWRASVDGDYVVTPDMVQGDRPVHFIGS
jgi:hypothetical protein